MDLTFFMAFRAVLMKTKITEEPVRMGCVESMMLEACLSPSMACPSPTHFLYQSVFFYLLLTSQDSAKIAFPQEAVPRTLQALFGKLMVS